jgi:hypothetical protein
MRERLPGCKFSAVETAIIRCDRMRGCIIIRPLNCGTAAYRQSADRKSKIPDRNVVARAASVVAASITVAFIARIDDSTNKENY